MSEYILQFPKPKITSREQFEEHQDKLDEMREVIWQELRRAFAELKDGADDNT